MFNMGQNVNRDDIGFPVLPMPYSDEGFAVLAAVPVGCDFTANADFYVVNGLHGGPDGIDFFTSRDYVDNNAEPAAGGRLTIANRWLVIGGSVMGGQFNDHSGAGPLDRELDYSIVGADIGVHLDDRLRVQFEYALRSSDRIVALPGKFVSGEEVSGFSVLGELRVCSSPRVGLVARYDTLSRNGDLPPLGSSLTKGEFTVQQFTWGCAVTLPGGSLLLFDHEHWFMPHELDDVDVFGLRWVVTF